MADAIAMHPRLSSNIIASNETNNTQNTPVLDGPATGASGTASPVAMLDTTASMRWTCNWLCLSRSTSSCASLRWRSSSFSMDAWSCSWRCSCVASSRWTWTMTSSSSRLCGGLFAGDADADRDRLSS